MTKPPATKIKTPHNKNPTDNKPHADENPTDKNLQLPNSDKNPHSPFSIFIINK